MKNSLFTGTVFLTILLSYERYMAVCKGKKLESKKILTYISIVCISAVIYGSPTLWMYKWDYSQNGEIISKWTKLACNKTFLMIYLVFLNIIFRLILPIVCLIVFNILIFKKVSNFTLNCFTWHKKWISSMNVLIIS